MVDINSIEGIESLIDKKTKVLKGQIRELQTELIAVKKALSLGSVGQSFCSCAKRMSQHQNKKGDWICGDCDEIIEQKC